MAIPILAALAGGGAAAGGGTAAAAGGGGLFGGLMGGGAGMFPWLDKTLAGGMKGGGGMGVSGLGPTPQTSGFMPNGQMLPQAWNPKTGQLQPVQQGPVGGPNPGSAQTMPMGGGQMGNPSQDQKSKLSLWQNLSDRINGFAFGLMQFGQALGGPHKEGLNMIPRNPIPIIQPGQMVNPGTQDLQSVMASIMRGGN